MRAIRRSLAALSVAALAACSQAAVFLDGDPVPGERSEQQRKWEAQNIDDYRFTYAALCFCPNELTDPMVVSVRDGRVTGARYVRTGGDVPARVRENLPTVDRLFAAIAAAKERGDYLDVQYHPQLGYPVTATIGTLANDAGTRHDLANLQPID